MREHVGVVGKECGIGGHDHLGFDAAYGADHDLVDADAFVTGDGVVDGAVLYILLRTGTIVGLLLVIPPLVVDTVSDFGSGVVGVARIDDVGADLEGAEIAVGLEGDREAVGITDGRTVYGKADGTGIAVVQRWLREAYSNPLELESASEGECVAATLEGVLVFEQGAFESPVLAEYVGDFLGGGVGEIEFEVSGAFFVGLEWARRSDGGRECIV